MEFLDRVLDYYHETGIAVDTNTNDMYSIVRKPNGDLECVGWYDGKYFSYQDVMGLSGMNQEIFSPVDPEVQEAALENIKLVAEQCGGYN